MKGNVTEYTTNDQQCRIREPNKSILCTAQHSTAQHLNQHLLENTLNKYFLIDKLYFCFVSLMKFQKFNCENISISIFLPLFMFVFVETEWVLLIELMNGMGKKEEEENAEIGWVKWRNDLFLYSDIRNGKECIRF